MKNYVENNPQIIISSTLAGEDFVVRLRRELSRTLSRTMKVGGKSHLATPTLTLPRQGGGEFLLFSWFEGGAPPWGIT